MRLLLCAAVLIGLGGPQTCAQVARSGQYRLKLTAIPPQRPADNKTEARVRIEVRTESGQLATEEVEVVISANLGYLSTDHVSRQQSLQVRAIGGVATVFASSNTPGLATITAWVRESRNSTTIRYLPEGEVARPVAKTIHIKGKWTGFSVDHRLLEARDQAQVRLGELTIEASDTIDIDLNDFSLRAFSLEEAGVVVSRGERELSGKQLYFDLGTRRGVLRGAGVSGIERVFFDAYDLQPLEAEWEPPSDAFSYDTRETQTWLVADSISYFIGEKIVLRHGSAWIDQDKILSFPAYWIIGEPGYTGSTNNNMFSADTGGGVALDFPFFYSVTDTTTAAVKVQHGTTSGSVAAARGGWSLAWEREYRSLTNDYEGSIEIAGLPRSSWGLQWQDQRTLWGDANSYLNFSMPDHHSIFSDASVYRYTDKGRFNLRAYYDDPRDYDTSYGLVGDWLSNPIALNERNSYRIGLTAGTEHHHETGAVEFGNRAFAELNWGTYDLGRKTTLRPVLRNMFSWDTSGYNANGLRADLDFTHRLSLNSIIGLSYSAEYFSGDATVDGIEQILSLDLSARRNKWYLYAFGTHNITFDDTFSYLDLNYYQSERWRWELAGIIYSFEDSSYNEWELTLARMFGQREIGLTYSEETGRLSLEFGGFATF